MKIQGHEGHNVTELPVESEKILEAAICWDCCEMFQKLAQPLESISLTIRIGTAVVKVEEVAEAKARAGMG